MRRTIIRGAVAIAAAAVLAASGASGHAGHCMNLFMLSGVVVEGQNVGTNPGAVSCQANDPDVHPDTNVTVPGSTHTWVALFDDFAAPTDGTLTIGDGEPVALTWTQNTLRGRWESQPIALTGVAPGTPIVARATVAGEFEELTYIRI